MDAESITIEREDGIMAVYRWAKPGAPRLFFAHANGFNARTYARLLEPLSAEFEILAPDLRGHGRSSLAIDAQSHRGWQIHAGDLAALIARFDDRPFVLAGHSMGATAQLMATSRLRAGPAGLVLIEPVVMPAHVYAVMHTPLGPHVSRRLPIVKGAQSRRDGWQSREAVAERYRDKATFRNWDEAMLEDYLQDGLVERDGQWHLACPPDWEAANFAAQRNDPVRAARRCPARIAVLRAGRGSTLRNVKGLQRAGAAITEWGESGHLLPMETPERVSAWLRAEAETCFELNGDPR